MKKMEFKWEKLPKTENNVLKLFRNFLSDEFSCEYVYPEGPLFKEWSVPKVLNYIDENGTEKEKEEINKMYKVELKHNILPLARTIHEYSKKYDSEWHENVYRRNYNLI